MEIVRLKATDFEEALDLLNLVFSQTYAPTNFATMLPLLYQPTDEHMRCNFAVREDGKIRAIVGLFPAQIQAGDIALNLGGIGGVSAHPNDRGKGWMKLLMNRCIEEMEKTATDLSFLIGLRQRYQYFGYEKVGTLVEHTVSKTNLRHVLEALEVPELSIMPLLPTDTALIEKAKALYDCQPFRRIRLSSEFYPILLSLNTEPWVALYPDGTMAGYLVCDQQKKRITEIFAQNDAAFAGMIRRWFSQQNISETTVILSLGQETQGRYLNGLAEGFRLIENANWRIFHWDKVIAALLAVKNSEDQLRDGAITVGIKGYGAVHISIRNGITSCVKTSLPPDVELEPSIAAQVLFNYYPTNMVTVLPDKIKPLIRDWFPLPLCLLPQNYV